MVVNAGQGAWQTLVHQATSPAPPIRYADGGWLILVPHPDDETLGAGGLIAALADSGNPAWILYLTDGEASHIGAPQWPAPRLARVRRDEAGGALRALGQPLRRVLRLGWADSHPPAIESARFRSAASRVLNLCHRNQVHNIATTWSGEAHCDHRSAYELARSIVSQSQGSLQLFEYLVWGWIREEVAEFTDRFDILAIDTAAYTKRCADALRRHRTQTTSLVRGARWAFRLPPEMIALASRAPMLLLRDRNAA